MQVRQFSLIGSLHTRLTQIDLPGQKHPVVGEASRSFCCFRNKLVNGTVSREVPSLRSCELSIDVGDLPDRSMSDGNIEGMFQRTLVILNFEHGVHWPPQADEIPTSVLALDKKRGRHTADPTCTKRIGFWINCARAMARLVASPSTRGGRDKAW